MPNIIGKYELSIVCDDGKTFKHSDIIKGEFLSTEYNLELCNVTFYLRKDINSWDIPSSVLFRDYMNYLSYVAENKICLVTPYHNKYIKKHNLNAFIFRLISNALMETKIIQLYDSSNIRTLPIKYIDSSSLKNMEFALNNLKLDLYEQKDESTIKKCGFYQLTLELDRKKIFALKL